VGALGRSRPGDVAKDHGPQDLSVRATRGSEGPAPVMPAMVDTAATGGGSLAPEMETTVAAKVASSQIAGEVVDQDPASSSSGTTISLSSPQPRVADA
jgi:hypothetical protein